MPEASSKPPQPPFDAGRRTAMAETDAAALLAAIIEASEDAIVSKDLDGNITSWNRGAEHLYGYTAAEAIGQPVTVLMPEDRVDEDSEILARIRRGERVAHYQTVRKRKDGSTVDISLTVSPIYGPDGEIVGASKIARDISALIATEAELRRSEARYRQLSELMPVGVYTCDAPTGSITYYNQHAARIWGRAPEIGDTDERFCGSLRLYLPGSPTHLPHEECPMAVALREGRSYRNEEVVIERPDGTRVVVLVNIDPIRDPKGDVTGAINTFHDITALKTAEHALREQKENLQTLLDTLPIAVFLAQDPECRLISGNRAAARILRMAPGANLSLTAPPGEVPRHFRTRRDGVDVAPEDLPIQRAARLGESVRAEQLEMEFDDGTVVHELVSAQPLFDSKGRPRGAVACILDVTELKHSENALREADRRKDEFLATLSHELRNPLAPILAGLEIMKLASDDVEVVGRTRDTIERQARQLVSLVDDLLDVSRITRDRLELRTRKLDLREIVRSAVETTSPAVVVAGHALDVELPDEPLYVRADPNRLTQVLANLLNNAAKYTPPEGRIRMVARREGGQAVVSVEDSGAGIPPELLGHIFEMFAQIDRPQEKGQPGLGVGLTLAKSLVEMHGGTIHAESAGVDRGSTFTVRLPAFEKPAFEMDGAEDAEAAGALRPNGRRVLVVDDNEALVDTLSTLMAMLGSEVRTAPDGQSAIDIAAEFRPDIVLMDLGMPGMNGYEAARILRQQPWGRTMKIVALTGWGQEEDKRRTRDAGFDDHLVKPARHADLVRLLDAVPRSA